MRKDLELLKDIKLGKAEGSRELKPPRSGVLAPDLIIPRATHILMSEGKGTFRPEKYSLLFFKVLASFSYIYFRIYKYFVILYHE